MGPLKFPVLDGLNVTVTVHFCPAASAPQSLLSLKSPLATTDVTETGCPPVLVTENDWVALLDFTICDAKVRFAADKVTTPGVMPVPDNETA